MHLNSRREQEKFNQSDHDLFNHIVDKYSDKLYSIVYRITNNRDNVLDILQNTFYKAYKNAEHFRGDSSIYTYLVSIAVNEARQYLRKEKPHLFMPIEENLIRKRHYTTADERIIRKDRRALLEDALSKLPEKYREVIILRDIEEFSIKETAEIINENESTVKTRTRRGRFLLRDLLESKIERM